MFTLIDRAGLDNRADGTAALDMGADIFIHKNSIFDSNSYILKPNNSLGAWLIDAGDSAPVIDFLAANGWELLGILLTHSHFDHIYGINELLSRFAHVSVYCSRYALLGLSDPRLNMSIYTENPFTVNDTHRVCIISPSETLTLGGCVDLQVIHTPGHNRDCLSFITTGVLFTGDALIPGIKVHTKDRYANRDQAVATIETLISTNAPSTLICAGHGMPCSLGDISIDQIT